MNQRELLNIVLREHDAGRRVALCAIVATHGSTPQPPGAMIAVDEAASIFGTIGGGCVEAAVRRLAHQRLGEPVGPLATFELDHDYGHDDGMICGGRMDIAIRTIGPDSNVADLRSALSPSTSNERTLSFKVAHNGRAVEYRVRMETTPRLVIAGAGHIGRVLSDFAVQVGFQVHVVDDRAEFTDARRFQPQVTTHVGDIAETLRVMAVDDDTFVVIVTRGHRHDESVLRAVINTPAKYIGMIGSRRKIDVIYEDLRKDGIAEAQLARVHAPIGVNIGAVRSDEIALSIAAELVRVRRATDKPVVEGPVPLPESSP